MKTDKLPQPINTKPSISAFEESDEPFDLGRLTHSLLRNWWIIAAFMAATTAAAGLKVLSAPSSYESQFEVLVKNSSAETDVISNIPETFSSSEKPEKITVDEDLLKILKSPKVLAPIVEEVKTRYPKFCNSSKPVVSKNAEVDSLCYEGLASNLYIGALEDTLDEDSAIVQVIFQDEDPEAVKFVLSKLSQAYLDYSLEIRQADIRRGINFVEQKLPDLRAKVNALQNQLQTLRLQNNIIDPTDKANQLAEQVKNFSQEQLQVEVELQQVNSVSEDLRQQLAQSQGQGTSSSALKDNPRYQTLLDSLLTLDSQIAEASTLYLDSSPDMQVLKEQRQNLLVLLNSEGEQAQREVVSKMRELESREQALQQTLQGLNTGIDQLTGVARSYDDIQRELTISTENLNQFLSKREAFQIDAAQSEIPWELVTPPTTPKPTANNLLKLMLLGSIVGLLLGVGVALLVDESSGVIFSEEELKRATRLPIIGSIPDRANAQEQVFVTSPVASKQYAGSLANGSSNGSVHNYILDDGRPLQLFTQDSFSESFRSLYTNLRLISSRESIKAIAISSVMPNEGKSTVALHLAQAAAGMGQRVLLVDANLRNPQIHNYLHLSNDEGLTNLFSGESNPRLIQQHSLEPNLYFVTAGSTAFDSTRLFSSNSMRLFTGKIRKAFDLVIYDTPSLTGQSDAYLIANYTDGMLLVAQPGRLKQSLLKRSMEQLQIANINVLGLVTREP